jgi:hypothetical protein
VSDDVRDGLMCSGNAGNLISQRNKQYDLLLLAKHIFSIDIHHQYSDGAMRVQCARKWCRTALLSPAYQYQMLAEQLSGKTNMSLLITFNTVMTYHLTFMT